MREAASGELKYRAPALEKGLDIIELLAGEQGGLSLSAVAGRLGRSLSEIYRIALALETRGYIRRDAATDTFMLTMRLFELATEHPPINRLLSAALPLMRALAESIEQSCHLAVIGDDDQLLVVAQVDSPRAMRYSVRLGARFPLLDTSSGAVLAAFSADQGLLARLIAATPSLADGLEARLAAARAARGERCSSLVVEGVVNLSRPVFDHKGVVAALTVPFLAQRDMRVGIDAAETALIEVAETLSAGLGGRSLTQTTRTGEIAA